MKRKLISIFVIMAVIVTSVVPVFAANRTVSQVTAKNKYELSYKIVNDVFNNSKITNPKKLVVVNGESIPDLISGSALAKAMKAPIVYYSKSYETKIVNLISDNYLKKQEIYIIGGTGAIPSTLDTKIKNKGYKVTRFAGSNRYETNMKVLKYVNGSCEDFLFVNCDDSLSLKLAVRYQSTLDDSSNFCIAIVNKNTLTASQKTFFNPFAPKGLIRYTYVVGTTSNITNNLQKTLRAKRVVPSASKLTSIMNKKATSAVIVPDNNLFYAVLGQEYNYFYNKGKGELIYADYNNHSHLNKYKSSNITKITLIGSNFSKTELTKLNQLVNQKSGK